MANKKSGYLQQDILNFINDKIEKIGRSPSYREIQAEFNLASSSHVDYYIRMLEKDGLITVIPKEDYGIRPTKTRRGIPIKGRIAAKANFLSFTRLFSSKLLHIAVSCNRSSWYIYYSK